MSDSVENQSHEVSKRISTLSNLTNVDSTHVTYLNKHQLRNLTKALIKAATNSSLKILLINPKVIKHPKNYKADKFININATENGSDKNLSFALEHKKQNITLNVLRDKNIKNNLEIDTFLKNYLKNSLINVSKRSGERLNNINNEKNNTAQLNDANKKINNLTEKPYWQIHNKLPPYHLSKTISSTNSQQTLENVKQSSLFLESNYKNKGNSNTQTTIKVDAEITSKVTLPLETSTHISNQNIQSNLESDSDSSPIIHDKNLWIYRGDDSHRIKGKNNKDTGSVGQAKEFTRQHNIVVITAGVVAACFAFLMLVGGLILARMLNKSTSNHHSSSSPYTNSSSSWQNDSSQWLDGSAGSGSGTDYEDDIINCDGEDQECDQESLIRSSSGTTGADCEQRQRNHVFMNTNHGLNNRLYLMLQRDSLG